ncbi:MAG: hypothetical protein WKF58_05000 [Ilumatobacteraceae bacterium]
MTLMKQARAYGVGVVLSTQNPVDIDYKAISNAGTWMIGRLQTERDKARLLDGLSAAAGGVDIDAVGATIAGLDKRQFVLRKAGEDQPEVFTTRWAMSYLRGPLTRDQIATLMADRSATSPGTPSAAPPSADATPAGGTRDGIHSAPSATNDAPAEVPTAPAAATDAVAEGAAPEGHAPAAPAPAHAAPLGDDETPVMPEVAAGVPIRYVDPAAPWLATAGAAAGGRRLGPAVVARVAIRYDERSAGDLVHTTEYEAVVFPLTAPLDVTRAIAVDYDDRDLVPDAPAGAVYQLGATELSKSATFTQAERDLADHLARTMTYELQVNRELKLFSRPGETPEDLRGAVRQRRRNVPTPRRPRCATSTTPRSPSCARRSTPPRTVPMSSRPRPRAPPETICCRQPGRCSAVCCAAVARSVRSSPRRDAPGRVRRRRNAASTRRKARSPA